MSSDSNVVSHIKLVLAILGAIFALVGGTWGYIHWHYSTFATREQINLLSEQVKVLRSIESKPYQ